MTNHSSYAQIDTCAAFTGQLYFSYPESPNVDDRYVFCNQGGESFCVDIEGYNEDLTLVYMIVMSNGQILGCRKDGCFSTDDYPATVYGEEMLCIYAVNFDENEVNPDLYTFENIPRDTVCIAISEPLKLEVAEPLVAQMGLGCSTNNGDDIQQIVIKVKGGLPPYQLTGNITATIDTAGTYLFNVPNGAYDVQVEDAMGKNQFLDTLEELYDCTEEDIEAYMNQHCPIADQQSISVSIFNGTAPFQLSGTVDTLVVDTGIYHFLVPLEEIVNIDITDFFGNVKDLDTFEEVEDCEPRCPTMDVVWNNVPSLETTNMIEIPTDEAGAFLICQGYEQLSFEPVAYDQSDETMKLIYLLIDSKQEVLAWTDEPTFNIAELAPDEGGFANLVQPVFYSNTPENDAYWKGLTTWGNALPEDDCWQMVPPAAFHIIPPIEWNVLPVCNEERDGYFLELYISGGLAAYLNNGTYTINGATELSGNQIIPYDTERTSTFVYTVAAEDTYFDLNAPFGFTITDEGNCETISITGTMPSNLCKTLPITLIDFRATAQPEGNLLEWETATEIDNDYFQLSLAKDGKRFEPLTMITAKGNNSRGNTYSYLHETRLSGQYYYRLEAVDLNQHRENHGVVAIDRSADREDVVLLPSANDIQLYFSEAESNKQVILYDINGRQIAAQHTTAAQTVVNRQHLPSGIYLLVVELEGEMILREKIVF